MASVVEARADVSIKGDGSSFSSGGRGAGAPNERIAAVSRKSSAFLGLTEDPSSLATLTVREATAGLPITWPHRPQELFHVAGLLIIACKVVLPLQSPNYFSDVVAKTL